VKMRGRRALVVFAAVITTSLITVGLQAIRAADSAGHADLSVYLGAFVVGMWLPIAMVLYALVRHRIAVVLLAFCVGVSVNVIFVAHAVPANAATTNTSDFYMSGLNGNTFGCTGVKDMYQTGPADSANGSVYSGGAGVSQTFCSDIFSSAQSLSAGTTVANMYFANSSGTKDCNVMGELFWFHASNSTTTSLGSGTTTIPHNNAAAIDFTWSWATSAVAAFADGDRLEYTLTFTSAWSNCSSTAYDAYYVGFASRITVATIVPETVAGLLLLAPALPLATYWWKRRRP